MPDHATRRFVSDRYLANIYWTPFGWYVEQISRNYHRIVTTNYAAVPSKQEQSR